MKHAIQLIWLASFWAGAALAQQTSTPAASNTASAAPAVQTTSTTTNAADANARIMTQENSAAANCPALRSDSNLRWDAMQVPGLLLCRAIRDLDGSEAFAVTLSRESPFKPRRGDRAEEAVIDGRKVYWYRSEVAAGSQTRMGRETLVELGEDRVAHISLIANSAEQLTEVENQVQAMRFNNVQLSSN